MMTGVVFETAAAVLALSFASPTSSTFVYSFVSLFRLIFLFFFSLLFFPKPEATFIQNSSASAHEPSRIEGSSLLKSRAEALKPH